MNSVDVSIVSHGQDALVQTLLKDLANHSAYISSVILTFNKATDFDNKTEYPFELVTIHNDRAKGFAENHNYAFQYSKADYFCVMNPDIRLTREPFASLLSCISDDSIGVVAPVVVNSLGELEDSYRDFPTPLKLLKKVFFKTDAALLKDKRVEDAYPDWLAGMFLLISRQLFLDLKGFDESYYLYYEDVDFSLRAWKRGHKVKLCSKAVVIHDAQRTSHKNLRYLFWHVRSLVYFFLKHISGYPIK